MSKIQERILHGKTANELHRIIKEVCKKHDIKIISGKLTVDHVHLFISYEPNVSVSKIVQYIKGESAMRIMDKFPELKKQYWGGHFWGRGYMGVSSGSITDEMVQEYIDNQDGTDFEDNFTIEP